ncbi:hypothetical protein D1007_43585 [Hordeum vulgare]|nr:hypothetical protein D1007_43585 [Hordeum vulgare]
MSYSMGSSSPKVSMIAPGTLAPMGIDLIVMPMGGGSSSGGAWKRPRELAADNMENACNLFDGMPDAKDEPNRVFMDGLILEGGGRGIRYDLDETQS